MANELILIVEDDEESRMLERDVLMFSGYRVLEAETGEAGLTLAREAHPALILMDIRLPGMERPTGIWVRLRRAVGAPSQEGGRGCLSWNDNRYP